jgi:hypothetical protein
MREIWLIELMLKYEAQYNSNAESDIAKKYVRFPYLHTAPLMQAL